MIVNLAFYSIEKNICKDILIMCYFCLISAKYMFCFMKQQQQQQFATTAVKQLQIPKTPD